MDIKQWVIPARTAALNAKLVVMRKTGRFLAAILTARVATFFHFYRGTAGHRSPTNTLIRARWTAI